MSGPICLRLATIASVLALATACEQAPRVARASEVETPSAVAGVAVEARSDEASESTQSIGTTSAAATTAATAAATRAVGASSPDAAAKPAVGASSPDAAAKPAVGASSPDAAAKPAVGASAPDAAAAPDHGAADEDHPDPLREFPNARFPRPEHVRGVYANAWAAGSNRRMSALLDLARETEVNAIVIDIKDATGYISHHTQVELAHQIGATGEIRIPDLPGLLDRLEAEGVYPIARIVIVKDPILTAYRPEYAIQDTAGGVWIDSKGITWLNPYNENVWKYHVDIAHEVAEVGFPEIQWDYVRFPDAPQADLDRAVYDGADGRSRPEAIRGFLEYARERLSDLPVRSTADVFGVTTTYERDIGTGQVWEYFIDVVDAALPMVYPSHYWPGSFGYREPNGRPYEIVRRALKDAVRRSAAVEGAGVIRPWLQDFSLGQPIYAGAEVRAQIQAAYDAGVQEWILWNPGSHYTVSALEPTGGFEREPLMRVAGVLAPVSRRHAVIDSIAALPPASRVGADEQAQQPQSLQDDPAEPTDSLRTASAQQEDSLRTQPAQRRDSLRTQPAQRRDSLRAAPAAADTIRR